MSDEEDNRYSRKSFPREVGIAKAHYFEPAPSAAPVMINELEAIYNVMLYFTSTLPPWNLPGGYITKQFVASSNKSLGGILHFVTMVHPALILPTFMMFMTYSCIRSKTLVERVGALGLYMIAIWLPYKIINFILLMTLKTMQSLVESLLEA